MDKRAIGVFDSGLGGLTTVKPLHELAPDEDIIFFGDNARVPYGNRGTATITRFALEDISLLMTHNVKMIIAACGTVSSTLSDRYVGRIRLPFLNVVTPTARAAAEVTGNGRIGVIGTSATIRSGSFARALEAIDPTLLTFCQPCPLFVPLVENGYIGRDNEVTHRVAADYLEPLRDEDIDTLILGCTHYPIIRDIIQDIMGDVTVIDSGIETARYALSMLASADALNGSGGRLEYYVSDDPEGFVDLAEMFLGQKMNGPVQVVSLDHCVTNPALAD